MLCLAGVVSGCALDTGLKEDDMYRPLIVGKSNAVDSRARSYVKIVKPQDVRLKQMVTINAPSIALMDAITNEVPGLHVVAMDDGVNMKRDVSVYAKDVTVTDYLKQLEGITDYQFKLDGETLYVSSMATLRWNVAALSGSRVGKSTVGSADGEAANTSSANNVTVSNEDGIDPWDALIAGAKSILGVSGNVDGGATTTAVDSTSLEAGTSSGLLTGTSMSSLSYVEGVRSLGEIMATGTPSKMRILDSWMSSMRKRANQQVRIDVRAFDVTLNDAKGRGIDWSAFTDQAAANTAKLVGSFPSVIPGAGTWSISGAANENGWTVDGLLTFLGNYGEVSVLNQPSLTVTNGRTAIISSGDEFQYVASIEQAQDANGNIVTTPVLEKMRLGLSLAVTARTLDDDRILIEVTPIISSLQGFDSITVGAFSFNSPSVALQELSTQVIASSGETVQLGGLITRKIAESKTRIPFTDGDGGIANFIFSSVKNELERRELVLTITPTLLGA
jgi:type II secretory pathway component GspD/PulD (secretin)